MVLNFKSGAHLEKLNSITKRKFTELLWYLLGREMSELSLSLKDSFVIMNRSTKSKAWIFFSNLINLLKCFYKHFYPLFVIRMLV